MTVEFSPQARDDLRRAYEYVAKDNADAADRLLARIVRIVGMLASGRVRGREVTLRDGRRVRAWSIPPYRLYYRARADVFEIVRIHHQARFSIER
ncbi:MAG: type II toxin-antitoxin system RelE/ParE family toxin [Candidatus Rokubacteria bacterium]|nr:type II toxin-antitoxin system RelE/ParE family toxin [Candidatus Rokubacteria bacterium]